MTILFVCTGNTCRSPLALAWWRALQSRGDVPAGWSAFSAGTSPSMGDEAAPHAVEIAQGWGVDLSEHRSRVLDRGALGHVDVCVAVAHSHVEPLARMLRQSSSSGKTPRVMCLSDFLPRSGEEDAVARMMGDAGTAREEAPEIVDPYGGTREAYETCASLIQSAVSRLARQLQEESAADAWPSTSPRTDAGPEPA